MGDLVVRIDGQFARRTVLFAGAVLLSLTAASELASESVTLSTYYPAPSGVYAQLITTGKTYLARDNSPTAPAYVGIGTQNPSALLDVNGASMFRGSMTIADGTQASGNVLTSDASGKASWKAAATSNAIACTAYQTQGFPNGAQQLTVVFAAADCNGGSLPPTNYIAVPTGLGTGNGQLLTGFGASANPASVTWYGNPGSNGVLLPGGAGNIFASAIFFHP